MCNVHETANAGEITAKQLMEKRPWCFFLEVSDDSDFFVQYELLNKLLPTLSYTSVSFQVELDYNEVAL